MNKKIKHFLQKLTKREIRFSQKAYIFLFCLMLSTFFWFLSALSKPYTTTLDAPLEYTSLSEAFILTEAPPQSLKISVNGSGFDLLGEQMLLNRKHILVNLKTAKKTTIEDKYYIPTSSLKDEILANIDPDIELMGILNDSLYLGTQKRRSKRVKVAPQLELNFAKAYKLRGAVSVVPDKVTLSGPSAYIDSVRAVYTEKIETKQLKDSVVKVVKLQLPKLVKGVMVKPAEVEVHIPVEKYTEKVLQLKIQSKNKTEVGQQLQTFPDHVAATFLVPLCKYNNLDETIVKAMVVYKKEDKENKKLKVEVLSIPQYVTLSKIEPERVEYIIKK